MAKLNQVVAIEKGVKSRVNAGITELHRIAQKADLFSGFSKKYLKVNEEGEDLPSETKKVQHTARDVLHKAAAQWTELFDVTARKDFTNSEASADVVVDGKVLVAKAPVSFLLFLEKQLNDIRTFAEKLPVLDDSEDWSLDPNSGLFRSGEVKTHRTKKVQKPLVLFPATPEHPAQTQLVSEDVLAGYWSQVKSSGAFPKPAKEDLIARVEALSKAVKIAREEANMAEVVKVPPVGASVFTFLFGVDE